MSKGSHSANVAAHAREMGHNHVVSRHVGNSAGFSATHLGPYTSPGPGPGAPFHDKDVSDDMVKRHQHPNPHGGNPYNLHDQNEYGINVLARDIAHAEAPLIDSPVPKEGRQMPDRDITSKAQEVAQATRHTEGEGFPGGGVLGRG